MIAFKAILDARSSRKKINSKMKKKKILCTEVEGNMNRNWNCADNPIEIEDDEDYMKNQIEIHSSKSWKIKKDPEELADDVISNVKKAIEIHSSNSLKLKKDRIDDVLSKGKKSMKM
ncbi:unnamed protein product [Lactuca virosa]|uniref:Uncharacterized protein n=1 Tax=Lactuca virosa TaxID=75947 RepID=A0AAU9PAN5_9ASTR|nr:unnamed protein product [Lactuca virosa]